MEPDKKSNGALVGAIIILLVLVIGGVYVWMSKGKNAPPLPEDTLSAEEGGISADAGLEAGAEVAE